MIRKFRIIGLSVAAVVMAMALSATAASAANFHSEANETVLTGTQEGEDVFTVNAGTVKCKKANYVGSQVGATNTTVSVAPSYEECTAFGFVSTKIDPNGCTYLFHNLTTRTVDVVCPAGKTLVVTAFNCEVTVGAQTGLEHVTFSNVGAGTTREVTVNVNLTNVKYTQHSKSFPGCTNGTFTNGTYKGNALVTGENALKQHVGVWAS